MYLNDIAANKKGKSQREVQAIDIDTAFLKSMMTDHKVSYSIVDNIATIQIQRREARKLKETDIQISQNDIEGSTIFFSSPSSSESKD